MYSSSLSSSHSRQTLYIPLFVKSATYQPGLFVALVSPCPLLSWWRIRLPMQDTEETQVRPKALEDPLEREMITYFSILAWKTWTEEPGGLYSPGCCQRVRYDWAHTRMRTHPLCPLRGLRLIPGKLLSLRPNNCQQQSPLTILGK